MLRIAIAALAIAAADGCFLNHGACYNAGFVDGLATPELCQAACQLRTDCNYWSWHPDRNDKRCHMCKTERRGGCGDARGNNCVWGPEWCPGDDDDEDSPAKVLEKTMDFAERFCGSDGKGDARGGRAGSQTSRFCSVPDILAATPRLRCGYSGETCRRDAVATTWIFRGDESRRRCGYDVDISRRPVVATPWLRCGYSGETSCGDAAAATWIFRGDVSSRRRGCHVDIPRRRVAATPWLRAGESEGRSR